MYDMTGSDDPQQGMQGGSGFGFGGAGINLEDIINMGFGGFGGFGGGGRRPGGQRPGGQRGGGSRTYTFTFGGAGGPGGMRFEF